MQLGVFLLPPLLALAIYIACVYLLLPLYRKRQFYSQYLPVGLGPPDGFVDRTRGRVREAVADFFGHRALFQMRRGSEADIDFNFGDEELEEDVLAAYLPGSNPQGSGERRLSRDLEAGFRDDSDDESDDRGRGILGR